ncbi:bifunctional oligoribonuclease/PAP phosphatase NrnA [Lujinxingia vulgaris]|uniref:Bifunctional oligoribonuclease/PAP phosphatase NrnA n=2 Tax=Lujinxingia vulgaris TaxID=2600176 RepID=A0A5C6XBP7_9DELT|nr:bifunctional oligoribonuclease/PAP phosphatase NrnA [Lujinxingia vulgaris]
MEIVVMSAETHHPSGAATAPVVIPTSPELEAQIDAFAELLDNHQRFLVVAHAYPDGDAVGSTLAMGLLLEQLGKDVTFFNVDPVPYNFRFLPGADRWITDAPSEQPEVTVMLDCAEPGRLGEGFPQGAWGTTIAVVDHHKTWDPNFATTYVRDVSAASTGELIYRLVRRYGQLSSEIAQNLYCCMMTDTGSFRYSNTSQTAFRVAGELVEAGADPWHMTSHIYEDQPRERLELLCRVLATLNVSECGRLAFLRVEDAMLEGLNSDEDLTDGFINYARSIRGVEVATQLREAEDDTWRVSFRSRGKVDVSALAEKFGGGGHHNAAGCRISGTPGEVESRLVAALVEMLDQPESP